MPRRAIGVSGFDIVAQSAMQLWRVIHQEPTKFQAARSLYIQISKDKFDDADDDQWAMALEAIRPGNMRHNLKAVKIVVVSDRLFEPYSVTTLSSSNLENPYIRAQLALANNKKPTTSRVPVLSGNFFAERAFIKALSNIRGVEEVEIAGPMEASLKKMLAVAMTTRPGHNVREWRNGGGLRSEDEISWGSWSAAMQPTGEAEQPTAAAYDLRPFYSQTFLPQQPMQIVTDASFDPDRMPSVITLGSFEEMAGPRLPLDGSFSPSKPDGGFLVPVKRADGHLNEDGSKTAHKKARWLLSPSANRGAVRGKEAGADGGSEQKVRPEGKEAKSGQIPEFVGMSPQPVGARGDAQEYAEAGDMQNEDDADDEQQGEEDVETEDWERDEEAIASDDPDDDDYQD
ncbi:hypothetical protein SLS58_008383 [Diplodia intermedia]|uniref:Uncharacterized protein n=1 Tax=Diplodia intermedia TaxID=856260 RepID=A0ABR3TI31_9PEZI